MNLFDYDGKNKNRKKASVQVAEQLLSKLSISIAEFTSIDATDASVHNELFQQRFDKAKRAYHKAKTALNNDYYDEASEHAVRGLLHLDLALNHLHSGKVDLGQMTAPAPDFDDSSEELISMLTDAICRIKLIVEYKGITLNKALTHRLSQVVQLLQDAIEQYGRSEEDNESHGQAQMAEKTAECGLVWAQFIYGQLTGDELYPKKSLSKSMRALNQFAWQSTAGIFSAIPSLQQIKEARAHLSSLEDSLHDALNAYLEGDNEELDKSLRLGKIEATSLFKYKEFATKDLDNSNSSLQNMDFSISENPSLRENLVEMADLLAKHHPDSRTAAATTEQLQVQLSNLKRSIKAEKWQEVEVLLSSARFNCQILKNEIAKIETYRE